MKERLISALVLIAATALCMALSPVTRVLFMALAGAGCAYELSVNWEKLNVRCTLWVMFLYLGAQALLVLLDAGIFAYVVCFVFCLYLALFSGTLHARVSGPGALGTLSGLCYPCLLFGLLMVICKSSIWLETITIGCIACWTCDAAALLGGSRFGRHKLAPLVSPNKTVEGSLFGAASSVISGFVSWLILSLFNPLPLWLCFLSAFLASSAGQVGDLSESLIKRMLGIKDFSDLIPGHGGLFDRADSLLFSVPTAYFCLRMAGILGLI